MVVDIVIVMMTSKHCSMLADSTLTTVVNTAVAVSPRWSSAESCCFAIVIAAVVTLST